jgi:hypothetical protein
LPLLVGCLQETMSHLSELRLQSRTLNDISAFLTQAARFCDSQNQRPQWPKLRALRLGADLSEMPGTSELSALDFALLLFLQSRRHVDAPLKHLIITRSWWLLTDMRIRQQWCKNREVDITLEEHRGLDVVAL